jgi:hypothetical protein
MNLKHIFYIIILISVFTSCEDDQLMKQIDIPSNVKSGDFFNQPDTYPVNELNYKSHSGTIIVPENRSKSNSRLIEIPFIQILATGDNVGDPIFFFNGGPGNSNINSYIFVNNLIENHDIILVGFRGVEGSVLLNLPEIDEFFANMPGDLTEKSTLDKMSEAYAKGAMYSEFGW